MSVSIIPLEKVAHLASLQADLSLSQIEAIQSTAESKHCTVSLVFMGLHAKHWVLLFVLIPFLHSVACEAEWPGLFW